jgi:hypothetical protein
MCPDPAFPVGPYFLPKLTVCPSLPNVVFHGLVTVLGTDVALRGQQELNVFGLGSQNGGELDRVGHDGMKSTCERCFLGGDNPFF